MIDSGVHVGHPHIRGVAGGVSIGPDGEIEENSFADRLGHGTAVMAVIQEKAGDAEYFAVRVFHGSLRSTARALFRAIEWSIEQRMDLINLSLGTRTETHREPFARLVERSLAAGVSVVSAREMEGQPCFPGCLPGVIGAAVDEDCDRHAYRVRETAEGVTFLASGYPRPAPGISQERNLQGISFAVANMTGFAARAMAGLGRMPPKRLRELLIEEARRR
jgi:hypothetical protein